MSLKRLDDKSWYLRLQIALLMSLRLMIFTTLLVNLRRRRFELQCKGWTIYGFRLKMIVCLSRCRAWGSSWGFLQRSSIVNVGKMKVFYVWLKFSTYGGCCFACSFIMFLFFFLPQPVCCIRNRYSKQTESTGNRQTLDRQWKKHGPWCSSQWRVACWEFQSVPPFVGCDHLGPFWCRMCGRASILLYMFLFLLFSFCFIFLTTIPPGKWKQLANRWARPCHRISVHNRCVFPPELKTKSQHLMFANCTQMILSKYLSL